MAVSTTPRDILNGAYGKSTKNRPGTIATETTELFQVVIRATRGLYAVSAQVNPTFFAEDVDVAFAAGWARPQTAESVFWIERTATTTGGTGVAGDEVALVPFNDRKAESGIGAVYRMAQTFKSAGNTPDPTGGPLKFFYAKQPTSPANLDATLDALWAESYNDLLIDEVAIYLALKDGRNDEVAALRGERDTWARQFVAFLQRTEINERRRKASIRLFHDNAIVPIGSLFAGGAELAA